MRAGGEEPGGCGQYDIIIRCIYHLACGGFPSPIEEVVGTIHGHILGCVTCDDLTTETEMDVQCSDGGGW